MLFSFHLIWFYSCQFFAKIVFLLSLNFMSMLFITIILKWLFDNSNIWIPSDSIVLSAFSLALGHVLLYACYGSYQAIISQPQTHHSILCSEGGNLKKNSKLPATFLLESAHKGTRERLENCREKKGLSLTNLLLSALFLSISSSL